MEQDSITFSPPTLDTPTLFQEVVLYLRAFDTARALETFLVWWNFYSIIALLLSILFVAGYVYARIRFEQLSEIENNAIAAEEREWARLHGTAVSPTQEQWNTITSQLSSTNPSDWRHAIIEADIMLERLLERKGYSGQTLGERLKSARPQSFQSLQDAWDAHKVRNLIAHAGGDFVLTRRRAQEAIVKYERVFREFGAV